MSMGNTLKTLIREAIQEVILENSQPLVIYRGKSDVSGTDKGLGVNSIGIGNRLVAALGPNFTDNIEIAKKFGKNIETKEFNVPNVLELKTYNDIIGLYKQYENELPQGLAGKIKNSSGDEQLELIQFAGQKLREILKKRYNLIKAPLAKADDDFLKSKGLNGSLYIDLS